jgi:hypothetical protein
MMGRYVICWDGTGAHGRTVTAGMCFVHNRGQSDHGTEESRVHEVIVVR